MSNYRKTMTEALQEMYSLDERMRMPRQLIDTNKEVMIVKKNKVIVIDKKDQDKYMKQGWELAEEVGLNEGTIDKVKEIASKKSAKKIDGVMVDSFTASAISQIYDKVNDANKKKMEKLPIVKLADLAFKMMQKNEFVPEEVDLDEGKMQDMWQKKNAQSLSVGPFELLRGKSGVHTIKRSGKVIGDFSYDSDADNFVANIKGMRGQFTGNDIDSLFTHLQKVHKEEVEESAASDARRAMRRDKDFSRRDSADDDTDATADDVKGASKNIMMQMRKAQSLNGRFDVEFADGKKVKIPAKMAIAVQSKYNKMRRPAEKEKFQAKVGKSYKDMLSALKEELQPKKESVLDRIDRKIKEKNDG